MTALPGISIATVERPATMRSSNGAPNPFAGLPLQTMTDDAAIAVTIPAGGEKRGKSEVSYVSTARGLIRKAAVTDGIGVVVKEEPGENGATILTFYGKTATKRPRKAKVEPVTVLEKSPAEQSTLPVQTTSETTSETTTKPRAKRTVQS